MRSSTAFAVLAAFLLGCSTTATHSKPTAVPSPTDPAPKRCLRIVRIDRSEIVDDNTILFHMRDGAIWRNALPQRCYGLRIQGGFGYTTPLDQLCDLDLIQVLGGSRSVCGLGHFQAYEPPLGVEANEFNAEADSD